MNYNPRQKSWHTFPLNCNILSFQGNLSVRPLPNVVYSDEAVIVRLQHYRGGEGGGGGGGGGGFPILVMPLGIVTRIPSQCIFVLSDPGVPRTFAVDCKPGQTSWHTF